MPVPFIPDDWGNSVYPGWHAPMALPPVQKLSNSRLSKPEAPYHHRSFGPSRLVDSTFDVPFATAGSLLSGFSRGLLDTPGSLMQYAMKDPEFVKFLSKDKYAKAAVSWMSTQKSQGVGAMAKKAFQSGLEGWDQHFAVHSPFAWGAAGIQVTGKTVGGFAGSLVGQVAGEAASGAIGGVATLGMILATGLLRNVPRFGNALRRIAAHGASGAPGAAKLGDALLEGAIGNVSKVFHKTFEPVKAHEAKNVVEALSGHRLKKGAEGLIGRAVAYGAPAGAFALGLASTAGQINIEPLAQRQLSGVVGSTYGARPGPNNIGASGDLVLALHAMR